MALAKIMWEGTSTCLNRFLKEDKIYIFGENKSARIYRCKRRKNTPAF